MHDGRSGVQHQEADAGKGAQHRDEEDENQHCRQSQQKRLGAHAAKTVQRLGEGLIETCCPFSNGEASRRTSVTATLSPPARATSYRTDAPSTCANVTVPATSPSPSERTAIA